MSDEAAPILELHNLSYRYPNGFQALCAVNFVLNPGEIVGLVGPSGAGKSTLLLHLNGLLPDKELKRRSDNHQPAVSVGGLPVCRENLPEIRRRVGFLFQDPDDQLFCPTVEEDVAFGPLNLGLPAEEIHDRVNESLDSVDLGGYQQRSTLQLSVGERKRVCLAGVLSCRPLLLALDEPFSNLDPRARWKLIEILRDFPGSQIVATHDLDLIVEFCQRVIVLDQGRIQADGNASDILSDAQLMEQHGLEVPHRLR